MYLDSLLDLSSEQLTQRNFEAQFQKFRFRFKVFLIVELLVNVLMLAIFWILTKIGQGLTNTESTPSKERIREQTHVEIVLTTTAGSILVLPTIIAVIAVKHQSRALSRIYLLASLITLCVRFYIMCIGITFLTFLGLIFALCKAIGIYLDITFIKMGNLKSGDRICRNWDLKKSKLLATPSNHQIYPSNK